MKLCLRCGCPVRRRVMATAKYCSPQCRQDSAMEAYKARKHVQAQTEIPTLTRHKPEDHPGR